MSVESTSFSAEEPRVVAVGGVYELAVYQIDMAKKSHHRLLHIEHPFDQGFTRPLWYPGPSVCCVEFVPHQPQFLAVSCREDNLIRIWNVKTKRLVWSHGTRELRQEYIENHAYASGRPTSQMTFDSTGSFLFYSAPAGMDVQVFELRAEDGTENLYNTHLVTTVSLGQPIASMTFSTLGDYLTIVTSSFLHKANLFRFFPDLPPEQKLAKVGRPYKQNQERYPERLVQRTYYTKKQGKIKRVS